ncbi:MAG TPA: DUF2520 domain-containing protein [Paludibacter sp.]|nr:DUF2520 domain-containing protein [Paludibacter sp.]
MKAVFIGSGNVATHLSLALQKKGVATTQVFSRTLANASLLAQKLNASYTNDPAQLDRNADIYFYALKDSALAHFLKEVHLPDAMHVHTAGSVSLSIFKELTAHYGVFYPLQTFSKNKEIDFSQIPICIEASNARMQEKLLEIANLLSNKTMIISSDQRKVLHIAAVFACNFSNYMYDIASELLNDVGVGFDILKPLIEETAEKITKLSPYDAQTGPALRYDKTTIQKHVNMLKCYPEIRSIYKDLSKAIYKRHSKS